MPALAPPREVEADVHAHRIAVDTFPAATTSRYFVRAVPLEESS